MLSRSQNHPPHTPWAPLFLNLGRFPIFFCKPGLQLAAKRGNSWNSFSTKVLDWQFYLCFPFRNDLPVVRINGWCQGENCGVLKYSTNFWWQEFCQQHLPRSPAIWCTYKVNIRGQERVFCTFKPRVLVEGYHLDSTRKSMDLPSSRKKART